MVARARKPVSRPAGPGTDQASDESAPEPIPRQASRPSEATRRDHPEGLYATAREAALRSSEGRRFGVVYADAYVHAYTAARGSPEGLTYGDTYAAAYARSYATALVTRPVPPPPPTGAARRRLSPVLLGLLGLSLALALLVILTLGHLNGDKSAGAVPGRGGSVSATPSDGSYTRIRVLPSGLLHVDQWIRSRAPLSGLTVSVPLVAGLADGTVRAHHLRVVTGGAPAVGPETIGTRPEAFSFLGANRVHLSYVLTGVVQRSSSAQGRALARVTYLDVWYTPQSGNQTTRVVGASVLNLACSKVRPDALPTPCGKPRSGAWQVKLAGEHRDDRVMAQLDLG